MLHEALEGREVDGVSGNGQKDKQGKESAK